MSSIAKEILSKAGQSLPVITKSTQPRNLYRTLKVMDNNGLGEHVTTTKLLNKGFQDCYYKVTSVRFRGPELNHGKAYGVEVWKGKVLNNGAPVEIRGGLKWNWVKYRPSAEHVEAIPKEKQASLSAAHLLAAGDQENDHSDEEEYEHTKKRLRDTQYELATTRTELERRIIQLEETVQRAEVQEKKLRSRIDTLEGHRRILYTQEKETTKKLQDLEDETTRTKACFEEDLTANDEIIKGLREENMDLKERLFQLQEQSRATESTLTQRVRALVSTHAHHEKLLAETRGNSESQNTLVLEKHQQLTEALAKILDLEAQNRQLRQNMQGLEDAARIERELKNQMTYIKQLEGQNRQLSVECKHFKQLYQNVEVLKEEKASMEQKLKMLDELGFKCAKLEVENGVLKKEKEQWTVFLRQGDMTDYKAPYELAKAVAQLRAEKATLLLAKGESDATLKNNHRRIEQLEQQIREVMHTVASQEEICREEASKALVAQRSKDLALRDAQNLRDLLKTYDMEEKTLMGGNYDAQKTARIEQLEALVQEYREKLDAAIASSATTVFQQNSVGTGAQSLLETIQKTTEGVYAQLSTDNKRLTEDKLKLQQNLEILRKENESLEAKLVEHEIAMGAGAFNPATSRILEINDSPANRHQAIRQKVLDDLKEENRALLEAYKALQQQRQQLQDQPTSENIEMVPMASLERLQSELDRIQQELAVNEKKISRLKSSWRDKADEFRQAVHSLLGYKLNYLEDGRVEMISAYAAQEDQSFVFRSGQNDEGSMQLVGTGSHAFMEDFKEEFEFWVNGLGSIPAFLSRVTLRLAESQAGISQEQQQQTLQPPQQRPTTDSNAHQSSNPFSRLANQEAVPSSAGTPTDLTQGSDMIMDL
ncbi:coiled-coil domain-containing protein mad1 [Actinomortierella ambigua]|uniref:Spindle assembly checkpoint component MAD1 n=1 Tax=Actinomortierella ambigua TaxID=1343610 RepID=A0A9P6QKH9_9FUNG|nr:coiled-coil domain-containing protein mad1 [Actinomortierella ambigua]